MPTFPTFEFTNENVKVRFLEPTPSAALNTRFMGLPRGVYVGYIPQVANGSNILTLATDPRLQFSTLKVGAVSNPVQVDIFTNQPVTLDFTGHTQFPVFVLARADYTTTTPTFGQIFTSLAGAVGPQQIAICVVNQVSGNLVVSTTIPTQRQQPLAFQGQEFGYMYGGATNDIVTAQSATNEVITARISLATGSPSANLSARLALDLAASYLASILGLKTVNVVGNAQIVSSGAGSVNVSSSFGALTRQLAPALTIPAGGSATAEGAITNPPDPNDQNVCFLIDDTAGARIVDALNNPIYGRLAASSGGVGGTVAFSNAGTTVTGTGTTFTSTLQAGDLILGADGNYYTVASIANNTTLAISPAYQGPNASGFASSYQRFTLNFYTRGSGSEVATNLVTAVNLRFFFPAWFTLDKTVFDATAYMKRDGERLVEPVATTLVQGRVVLAIAGALAGALYQVESNEAVIGANNFHVLNFTAENALVTDAGGGVANIALPGNPGPPGPGALPGPTGPQGNFGPGAQILNFFQLSGTFGPGGSGTYSVDFSAPPSGPALPSITHVIGGFAQYDANVGNVGFGFCEWQLTNITRFGTVGTIDWNLSGGGGQAEAKFFLGATF